MKRLKALAINENRKGRKLEFYDTNTAELDSNICLHPDLWRNLTYSDDGTSLNY